MKDWKPGFPLTRRDLALLAAAAALTSCKGREETATSATTSSTTATSAPLPSAVNVTAIDVHTHLFNANFLPLDGIFAKWVSGSLAGAIARLLLSHVDDCSRESSDAKPLRSIEASSEQQLLESLYGNTPASAFTDPKVVEGLREISPREFSREAAGPPEAQKARAREEFMTMFDRAAEGAKEMFPEKGGFFQWVTLMTWCESKIWAALREAYPDVQLFVAHMMDMENYYSPSKPRYEWPDEQLKRMAKLTRAADGRLLTFFAFDPKRDDWEKLLDRAIESGCAGVKFYPPNGYAPFDTKTNSIPKNTIDLFRRCVRDDLPIFTHTTSQGFEALTGNGKKFAGPRLWRPVLQLPEFSNLRLCFAHAGGEEGWFPRDGEADAMEEPFSKEVIALCREFPNVYCEVAYLSPILTPEGQKQFQVALSRATGTAGKFPFAKKVMYGSDWHMIHKIRDHRAYLKSFRAALADSKWDSLREDFFSRNAVRWLNLGNYVKRTREKNPDALSETAAAHLRSLMQV